MMNAAKSKEKKKRNKSAGKGANETRSFDILP